jgi:hypothetical protein
MISKEGHMRTLGALKQMFIRLANLLVTPPHRSDFVCGECERWERCGLPPSDKCIVRAAQIARNGGRPIKRVSLPQC